MKVLSKHELNLEAKRRVCSELQKLGIGAIVVDSGRKSEVRALDRSGAIACRIEVRASQDGRFVTSLSQRHGADDPNSHGFWERRASDPDAPEVWVFCQLGPGSVKTRFFVATHAVVCRLQAARNRHSAASYVARHGDQPDSTKGVDNILMASLEKHENQWERILKRVDAISS